MIDVNSNLLAEEEYKYISSRVPIVGVDCLILNSDNKFLVCLRNVMPAIGRWTIPGGRVYLGESIESAVKRKCLEETGQDVEIIEMVSVSRVIYFEYYDVFVMTYLCKQKSSLPVVLDFQHKEFKWIDEPCDNMEEHALNVMVSAKTIVPSNSIEISRQKEQLKKYICWKKLEGGNEGPTHLSTFFKSHQDIRLKWLKLNSIGTVMELGCNIGYVLAYCGGQIGVDWNENTIALAKILNPGREFVVSDIRKLPFPDSYVDTVLCTDILEHLQWDDVNTVIKEAIRVARHRILVTIPNGDNDTLESTSMKHQFLATSEKIDLISKMFSPYAVMVIKDLHFVFIRVDKGVNK